MNNRQPARLWVKNEMSWSRCLLKVSVLLLIQTVSSAQSQSPQDLFRAAEPAVVRLDILDETGKVIAHGSGFLVSTDGRFLTNFHVVKGARQITVRLSNDDAYDTVEVVDVDRRKDIALLKIKGVDLPILQLGKSADVKVGDPILCIGTPLGQESLKNTLSNGIVSGIRSANGYRLFQVTAPVSQGSSGGPVLSMRGEVIGIVVANVPDAQNLNFVIPSDYARGMLRTSTTQPLTSIYEPRESEPASKPATEEPKPVPTALEQTRAEPPEDIRKQGLLPFLASKRFKWTEEDAKSTLGDALVHRFSYDNNRTTDGDIYSYNDPTKTARMLELCFDTKTKKLRWASVFLAAKGTKDDSKRMFGDKFAARKNPDGSSFHVYSDKQMNVYFDKSGLLGFIQVY